MDVLQIHGDDQVRIKKAMKTDSCFLMRHNLMDYSLYLAVEKHIQSQSHSLNNKNDSEYDAIQRNIITSSTGKEYYHFGIIDYLQKWDMAKKQERCIKTKLMHKNKH